jgi:hypothetical protein
VFPGVSALLSGWNHKLVTRVVLMLPGHG